MSGSENVSDTTIPTGTVAGTQPPLVVPEELRDLGLEQPEKRCLIGKFVLWLNHTNYCHNRPEYQAAYPGGCTSSKCRNMIKLEEHSNKCTAGDQCTVTDCTLSKRIFSHCKMCTLDRCSVCELYNYRLNQRNRSSASKMSVGTAAEAVTDALKRVVSVLNRPADPTSNVTVHNTKGSASSVEDVKAATPMRQAHTGPPPAVVTYDMDDIEVFRASHDLFGSLQAASSPTGPQLMAPQRWHAEMAISDFASAISLRSDKIRKIADRLCPNNGPSDMADPRIAPRIAYAQNVEAKLYQQSTSEGEYYRDMAAKIDTSPKENSKGANDSDWRLERQTAVALRVNGNHNYGFQSGNDVCIPMDNPSKMACAGKACICGPQLQTDHGTVPVALKVFVCVVVFLLCNCVRRVQLCPCDSNVEMIIKNGLVGTGKR